MSWLHHVFSYFYQWLGWAHRQIESISSERLHYLWLTYLHFLLYFAYQSDPCLIYLNLSAVFPTQLLFAWYRYFLPVKWGRQLFQSHFFDCLSRLLTILLALSDFWHLNWAQFRVFQFKRNQKLLFISITRSFRFHCLYTSYKPLFLSSNALIMV